ncbi:MAG: neutral/alkaline non-lysosomal ceramidase N-terminal domain-containing protein [Cyclobacteriaceae bacterium]
MKIYYFIALALILQVLIIMGATAHQKEGDQLWQAGVARVAITPDEPMWMAGYASRDRPSEGTLHELWAKALVLEDINQNRMVFISTDLVGIPKAISDRIRENLKVKYGLVKDQILLNSSHTHTGPALHDPLREYQILPQYLNQVKLYSKKLESQIVDLVGQAMQSMKPSKIYSENGVTRFQVNRRNNNEATLNQQMQLNGPNDYDVPVIKVMDDQQNIFAILFGYACHNTVLSGYQWSGDYAGFAQIELESLYPGTTALFFQGAGGDQNPLPRRTVELAKKYGKELAGAVECVLNGNMKSLSPHLSVSYSDLKLPLDEVPNREELVRMERKYTGVEKQWAKGMLDKIDQGETLMTSYPYPVQVLKLGSQIIVGLGGELVIDYAIKLKQLFGRDIFVFGYSNDPNCAYIPSTRIIREGGYEGFSSLYHKGFPSTWSPLTEIKILHEVVRLAETIGASPIQVKLIKD